MPPIKKNSAILPNQRSETETGTEGGEKQDTNRNFVFLHPVGPRIMIYPIMKVGPAKVYTLSTKKWMCVPGYLS